MACPTCDHTMQGVSDDFWCPRCGTRKLRNDVCVPRLVGRARELTTRLEQNGYLVDSIHEAIYKPEDRPLRKVDELDDKTNDEED